MFRNNFIKSKLFEVFISENADMQLMNAQLTTCENLKKAVVNALFS